MADTTRRKAVSRRHGQGAVVSRFAARAEEPVKKRGHAYTDRAQQAHGPSSVKEHQGRDLREKTRSQSGISVSPARQEAAGSTRPGICEATKGDVRPRMLLASAFGPQVRSSKAAENQTGFLATQTRGKSTSRSPESKRTPQTRLGHDGRLGMSDQEHQAPYVPDSVELPDKTLVRAAEKIDVEDPELPASIGPWTLKLQDVATRTYAFLVNVEDEIFRSTTMTPLDGLLVELAYRAVDASEKASMRERLVQIDVELAQAIERLSTP